MRLSPHLRWLGSSLRCRVPLSSRRCYSIITTRSYDDAVDLLNTLQTSFKMLKDRRHAGIRIYENANLEMRKCLTRIGYSQGDLDKLKIVHVAGTKGKGSTCAYVDSILSQYRKSHDIPYKVGLFTSPHLIAVRERIRINLTPLSADLFAKYFFEVWDRLEASASDSTTPFEKPVYFRYLTLMSYHVFLQERVDAAIYEVGVGGEYDSTNIVERPAVTGISALGIDHTFTLGETVDKIAWHKAGIQKKGVPSLTVPQIPAAMEVLKKRAEERGVESFNVINIDQRLKNVKIRPDAPFQRGNASLAIALAEKVLQKLDPKFKINTKSLPAEFVNGLEQVIWRGRCEKKVEEYVTWYLDGAHTADSIVVAAKWFGDEVAHTNAPKVLVFNQQGHREAIELLEGLYKAIKSQTGVWFSHVVFCPTVPITTGRKDHISHATDSVEVASLALQRAFADKWQELDGGAHIEVLPGVEEAFEYVRNLPATEVAFEAHESLRGRQPTNDLELGKVHVLVTGSVHLVGRALGELEGADAL